MEISSNAKKCRRNRPSSSLAQALRRSEQNACSRGTVAIEGGGGGEERILCESQLMRLEMPDGAGVFMVFLGEVGENSSPI